MAERQPKASAEKPERLHFLDWFRTVMIWCVVYAHLTFADLTPSQDIMVDNHAFANVTDRNGLGIRYNSIVRQWCIPLLFWVSGAAAAIRASRDVPTWSKIGRDAGMIAIVTVAGLLANALVWHLGPQDPECPAIRPCNGKGVLFDFTIVPHAGAIFPIVFQMWFTFSLMGNMALNQPLFSTMAAEFLPPVDAKDGEGDGSTSGPGKQGKIPKPLVWQLVFTILFSRFIAHIFRKHDRSMLPLIAWMSLCEFVFLASAYLSTSYKKYVDQSYHGRIPIRMFHYICALAMIGQVAGSPFLSYMSDAFGMNTFLMATKCYGLGFIMVLQRKDAKPLVSTVWPLAAVLSVLVAPSTNWDMAGHMTYPYFLDVLDRCLYFGGSLVFLFTMDRVSRDLQCDPVPGFFNYGGLLLYLFHPAIATVWIQMGFSTVLSIWFSTTVTCMCIVLGITAAWNGGRSKLRDREGNLIKQPLLLGHGQLAKC